MILFLLSFYNSECNVPKHIQRESILPARVPPLDIEYLDPGCLDSFTDSDDIRPSLSYDHAPHSSSPNPLSASVNNLPSSVPSSHSSFDFHSSVDYLPTSSSVCFSFFPSPPPPLFLFPLPPLLTSLPFPPLCLALSLVMYFYR